MYEKTLKLKCRVSSVQSGHDYFRWPAYYGTQDIVVHSRTSAPGQPADVDLEELERQYQERSEAAYKFGVEDGKAIGLEQGKKEVEQAVEYVRQMAEMISMYQKDVLNGADEIITRLAVSIAGMIIQREITADATVIQDVAARALKLVDDRRRIRLKVNPQDWQALKDFESEIRSAAHGVQELEIKEDSGIARGGCVIESESGIIDAQLDSQLEEIRKSIKGGL